MFIKLLFLFFLCFLNVTNTNASSEFFGLDIYKKPLPASRTVDDVIYSVPAVQSMEREGVDFVKISQLAKSKFVSCGSVPMGKCKTSTTETLRETDLYVVLRNSCGRLEVLGVWKE